jgi:hypothetical protein
MRLRTGKRRRPPKTGQVGICVRAVSVLRPSPENDRLYRPVDPSDPEVKALAESIKKHGVKEPLVVTEDGYLLSGHRRWMAARIAGLKEVPCRVEPIRRLDDLNRFIVLLREYNRQRVKSFDERLREELATVDPADAYDSLVFHRFQRAMIASDELELDAPRARAKISSAKQPMLDAIKQVLEDRKDFWPLSDRQIHYALMNAPPLRHGSKPKSRYANDRHSYGDLCDLLTRARLAKLIPFHAIADETRPVMTWQVHREPGTFIRSELEGLLKGYWRDLLQSQPNHLEMLVEKNTVAKIVETVCSRYCIPLTSGRGYCSLPPRWNMAQRYRKSGKDKLILLIVSDFDPDGEAIAESFARSMRDDFGIANLHPMKVALTSEQVEEFGLVPEMEAKTGSKQHAKFVAKFGTHTWEVEALPPEQLQELLEDAIQSVLDLDAFERECEAERLDAQRLEGVRRTIHDVLQGTDFGIGSEDEP